MLEQFINLSLEVKELKVCKTKEVVEAESKIKGLETLTVTDNNYFTWTVAPKSGFSPKPTLCTWLKAR